MAYTSNLTVKTLPKNLKTCLDSLIQFKRKTLKLLLYLPLIITIILIKLLTFSLMPFLRYLFSFINCHIFSKKIGFICFIYLIAFWSMYRELIFNIFSKAFRKFVRTPLIESETLQSTKPSSKCCSSGKCSLREK